MHLRGARAPHSERCFRKWKVLAASILFGMAAGAQALTPAQVNSFTLPNGMKFIVLESSAIPNANMYTFWKVGSRNEAPGNTGSAHLLEHMLFNKSTEHFGKAKGHKTIQDVLYEAGADFASSNMTTWYDRMNGYSTLPSGKLALAMQIDADRMPRALRLDEERKSEMAVGRNDDESGEDHPYRAQLEQPRAGPTSARPHTPAALVHALRPQCSSAWPHPAGATWRRPRPTSDRPNVSGVICNGSGMGNTKRDTNRRL